MVFRPELNLDYLNEKPQRINWQIVAGPEVHSIQMHDVVYDDYDFKIRQLEISG